MAGNILGIFAALFLGVAAYFAWINKVEYEEQIADRQEEERGRAAAQTKLTDTIARKDAAQIRVNDLKDIYAEAETELEEQKSVVAELQAEKTDVEESIAEVNDEIDKNKGILASVGDPVQLIADVKAYKASISEHEIKISAEEAKKAGLENTSANLVASTKATRDYIGLYSKQQSNPKLNTSIANIHGGFGFVTIKGGDTAGVIKGSTLQVIRGGETIAKILVTSVERNIAAGNIIPDSLAPDTSVLPGDKVIADIPASN